jgi:hypothetical protein
MPIFIFLLMLTYPADQATGLIAPIVSDLDLSDETQGDTA